MDQDAIREPDRTDDSAPPGGNAAAEANALAGNKPDHRLKSRSEGIMNRLRGGVPIPRVEAVNERSQDRLQRQARQALYLGVLHDIIIASLAFAVAYFSRVGIDVGQLTPTFFLNLTVYAVLGASVFWLFGLNRGSWRYTSTRDLLQIIKAALVLSAVFALVMFIAVRGLGLPRSVPLTVIPFLIVGLSAPRMIYRLARENGLAALLPIKAPPVLESRRVVLVHTLNDHAEMFIRAARAFSHGTIQVAGIIDDRPERHSQQIHGVRVLGDTSDIAIVLGELARRNVIVDEIVLADLRAAGDQLVRIVSAANAHKLRVSRLPELGAREEIGAAGTPVTKPINLDDLLNRPEIQTDRSAMAWTVAHQTVLVTGAGGSIGSELARQLAMLDPARLVLTDSSEFMLYQIANEMRQAFPAMDIRIVIMNVRDRARVRAVFEEHQPRLVFHAAALKHVTIVEANPLEGIKTNVLGTRNVADAAGEIGARAMVAISTDKAVNPLSVMGATKLAAEIYCQQRDRDGTGTRYPVVRFGNVLGSNGSVVPRFAEQIAKGGPVTVTDRNVARYFMSIPEAVRLVLHASDHSIRTPDERGKVLLLDMGEPVLIDDLARKMIILAGRIPEVEVPITYVGLQPGEKLREELFDAAEQVTRSSDGHYMLATGRKVDARRLARAMDELDRACAAEDVRGAIEALGRLMAKPKQSSDAGNVVFLPEGARPAAKS